MKLYIICRVVSCAALGAGLLSLAPAVAFVASAQATHTARAAHAPRLSVTVTNITAATRRPKGTMPRPGDVLRYTLTFFNSTGKPLRNVVLEHPVPASMHLVAGSTRSSRPDARLEFSADAGRTWSPRPAETVILNGRRITGFISPDRYTSVRWTVAGPIMPHAKATAKFDARLVHAGS